MRKQRALPLPELGHRPGRGLHEHLLGRTHGQRAVRRNLRRQPACGGERSAGWGEPVDQPPAVGVDGAHRQSREGVLHRDLRGHHEVAGQHQLAAARDGVTFDGRDQVVAMGLDGSVGQSPSTCSSRRPDRQQTR